MMSGLVLRYSSSSINHLAPRGFMVLIFKSTGWGGGVLQLGTVDVEVSALGSEK